MDTCACAFLESYCERWCASLYQIDVGSCQEDCPHCWKDRSWQTWKEWGKCSPNCYTEKHRKRLRFRSCSNINFDIGAYKNYCPGSEIDVSYDCPACNIEKCQNESGEEILLSNLTSTIEHRWSSEIDEKKEPVQHRCNWTLDSSSSTTIILYFQSSSENIVQSLQVYIKAQERRDLSVDRILEGVTHNYRTNMLTIGVASTQSGQIYVRAKAVPKDSNSEPNLPQLGGCVPGNLDWQSTKSIDKNCRVIVVIEAIDADEKDFIQVESLLPSSNITLAKIQGREQKTYSVPVYGYQARVHVHTSNFQMCRIINITYLEEPILRCPNDSTQYNGMLNVSSKGHPCLHWKDVGFDDNPSLDYSLNYCRSTNVSDIPWCYINVSGVEGKDKCNTECNAEKDENYIHALTVVGALLGCSFSVMMLEVIVIWLYKKIKSTKLRNGTEYADSQSVRVAYINNSNSQYSNIDISHENVYVDLREGVYDVAFVPRERRDD